MSVNKPATPSRLRATTKKPETAPPRSAVCNALFISFVTAEAVRILDRIATPIPIKTPPPHPHIPRRHRAGRAEQKRQGCPQSQITGTRRVVLRVSANECIQDVDQRVRSKPHSRDG